MEFQVRGVQIADPRFHQYVFFLAAVCTLHGKKSYSRYCHRLQTNITWLAAAADQRHNVRG